MPLKMYDTGIFDIKVDTYGANGVNDTCAAPNVTGDPACEYTACYTTRGERCVFPFLHEWENGTMIQYTTCAGIDVHRQKRVPPYFTELDFPASCTRSVKT